MRLVELVMVMTLVVITAMLVVLRDYDNDDDRGDIAAILETSRYLLKQMHCSNLRQYPFS